ncbi:glutamyl-tRNA(Gln) amidotransferase subunit A [Labrys miyagiensis]
MSVTRPTLSQLARMAERFEMHLVPDQLEEMHALMQANLDAYDVVDALAEPKAVIAGLRQPGYRPSGEENHYGAWARKSLVEPADEGPLTGKTVVLKDNVALAGVPMMNGSQTLEHYVPTQDATIVSRILAAGGTILGKATCEHFCMSGGSHTSDPAPVENPWRAGHSAGGSSSGCAALVALREADMAIGGDQGGSIRIPSSYCGIYGMKPTHGLVPYTSIMPIEATLDHAGPMTATVADNALLLEVIAGPDGLDPRQRGHLPKAYSQSLGLGAQGLRVGLVKEGFTATGMVDNVAGKVRAGAARFSDAGARLVEISIPEHAVAASVWAPIALEGLTVQMMLGNGMGYNWKGRYDVGLIDAHAAWRQRVDDLSPPLKLAMLSGWWGIEHYRGRYYAKAQNLARLMKAAYDRAFSEVDLLLMPTVPRVASPLPARDAPLTEIVTRAAELNVNTASFDVTGHPAMSLPCGLVDGLPVGMMLVGREHEEETIYRAASVFETSGDWRHF